MSLYYPRQKRNFNSLLFRPEPKTFTMGSAERRARDSQHVSVLRDQAMYDRILQRQHGQLHYTTCNVETWNVDDVADWALSLPLVTATVGEIIKRNAVDGLRLVTMKHADWEALGIMPYGDRCLLVRAHPIVGHRRLLRTQRAGTPYCLVLLQSACRARISSMWRYAARQRFLDKNVDCALCACLSVTGDEPQSVQPRHPFTHMVCRIFVNEVITRPHAAAIVVKFLGIASRRRKCHRKMEETSRLAEMHERGVATTVIAGFVYAHFQRLRGLASKLFEQRNEEDDAADVEQYLAACVIQCMARQRRARACVREEQQRHRDALTRSIHLTAVRLIERYYHAYHLRRAIQHQRASKWTYEEACSAVEQERHFVATLTSTMCTAYFSQWLVRARIAQRASQSVQSLLRHKASCAIVAQRLDQRIVRLHNIALVVGSVWGRARLSELRAHCLVHVRAAVLAQAFATAKTHTRWTWRRKMRKLLKRYQAFARAKHSCDVVVQRQRMWCAKRIFGAHLHAVLSQREVARRYRKLKNAVAVHRRLLAATLVGSFMRAVTSLYISHSIKANSNVRAVQSFCKAFGSRLVALKKQGQKDTRDSELFKLSNPLLDTCLSITGPKAHHRAVIKSVGARLVEVQRMLLLFGRN
eukprot:PhM_4_TR16690/c0_g1_i1/m.39577